MIKIKLEKKIEEARRILSRAEDLRLTSVVEYEKKKLIAWEIELEKMNFEKIVQIKLEV